MFACCGDQFGEEGIDRLTKAALFGLGCFFDREVALFVFFAAAAWAGVVASGFGHMASCLG